MVNDRLNGERRVHACVAHGLEAPKSAILFSPGAHRGKSLWQRIRARRRRRADRSNFRQMPLFQILIKLARPGERRFQGSSVWWRPGKQETTTGTRGAGTDVKGQGHVLPPPDGVLVERRPGAAA